MEIEGILGRLKQAAGIKKDNEIAGLLGLTPQNFSNRKKRGTLAPLIAEWAIKSGANAAWILHNEGEMCPATSRPAAQEIHVKEAQAEYQNRKIELTQQEFVLLTLFRQLGEQWQEDLISTAALAVDSEKN